MDDLNADAVRLMAEGKLSLLRLTAEERGKNGAPVGDRGDPPPRFARLRCPPNLVPRPHRLKPKGPRLPSVARLGNGSTRVTPLTAFDRAARSDPRCCSTAWNRMPITLRCGNYRWREPTRPRCALPAAEPQAGFASGRLPLFCTAAETAVPPFDHEGENPTRRDVPGAWNRRPAELLCSVNQFGVPCALPGPPGDAIAAGAPIRTGRTLTSPQPSPLHASLSKMFAPRRGARLDRAGLLQLRPSRSRLSELCVQSRAWPDARRLSRARYQSALHLLEVRAAVGSVCSGQSVRRPDAAS